MKIKFMSIFGLLLTVLIIIIVFPLPVKSDTGKCCPEIGSDCVIDNVPTSNKYYKAQGDCPMPI
jgi:hypothetical protein